MGFEGIVTLALSDLEEVAGAGECEALLGVGEAEPFLGGIEEDAVGSIGDWVRVGERCHRGVGDVALIGSVIRGLRCVASGGFGLELRTQAGTRRSDEILAGWILLRLPSPEIRDTRW